MARRHRRPRASRPLTGRAVATLLIEPVATPDRGVRPPARHRPEDGPAADLPPPASPGRGGAGARGGAHRRPRPGRVLRRCFNISDAPLCAICRDPGRDQTRLCVVEEPLDVLALERTGEFRGLYHVLHGAISPIDGIGPDRLRIAELLQRVDEATATARRSSRSSSPPTRPSRARPPRCTSPSGSRPVGSVTRIARGIPVGGDLEYADEVTLIRALQGRRAVGSGRVGDRVMRDPAGRKAAGARPRPMLYLSSRTVIGLVDWRSSPGRSARRSCS